MSEKPMSWEEFLEKRDTLVGKDIESSLEGVMYRGPITTILLDGNFCVFDVGWWARFETQGDRDWVMASPGGESVILVLVKKEITLADRRRPMKSATS